MVKDQRMYNTIMERVSREFKAGRPLSIGNHLNTSFNESSNKMNRGKEIKRSRSPMKKARSKPPINIGVKSK